MDPWCSGLTCLPVTEEIAGSNPVGSAIVYEFVRSWRRRPGRLFLFLCMVLPIDFGVAGSYTDNAINKVYYE